MNILKFCYWCGRYRYHMQSFVTRFIPADNLTVTDSISTCTHCNAKTKE